MIHMGGVWLDATSGLRLSLGIGSGVVYRTAHHNNATIVMPAVNSCKNPNRVMNLATDIMGDTAWHALSPVSH